MSGTVFAEVARYYGSTRSLTQDLGTLSHLLHDNTPDTTKTATSDTATKSTTGDATTKSTTGGGSFSSYLATRTRSPARPPLTKASSLGSAAASSAPMSYIDSLINEAKEKIETKQAAAAAAAAPSPPPAPPSATSKSSPEATRAPKFLLRSRSEKASSPPDPPSGAAAAAASQEMSRAQKSKKIIESLRVSLPKIFFLQMGKANF